MKFGLFIITLLAVLSPFIFTFLMQYANQRNNIKFEKVKEIRKEIEMVGRTGLETVVVENNSKEFDPCVDNAISVLKEHGLVFQYGKGK